MLLGRLPGVRRWVDARLRDLTGPFVVEGRDMGTAVFPAAAHKVYLEAPAAVRAERKLQSAGDGAGDFVLHREDVGQLAVPGFRPQVLVAPRIEQLRLRHTCTWLRPMGARRNIV